MCHDIDDSFSFADYEAVLVAQGGVWVRGLVHFHCNLAIGRYENNSLKNRRLVSMIEAYLKKSAARARRKAA